MEMSIHSFCDFCLSGRVLKLKEDESNTDQIEIAEDFIIKANRENCVSFNRNF